jgi:hypothetical protein
MHGEDARAHALQIEAGVKDGKLDTRAITTTLIARSVLSIFALVISSLRYARPEWLGGGSAQLCLQD